MSSTHIFSDAILSLEYDIKRLIGSLVFDIDSSNWFTQCVSLKY